MKHSQRRLDWCTEDMHSLVYCVLRTPGLIKLPAALTESSHQDDELTYQIVEGWGKNRISGAWWATIAQPMWIYLSVINEKGCWVYSITKVVVRDISVKKWHQSPATIGYMHKWQNGQLCHNLQIIYTLFLKRRLHVALYNLKNTTVWCLIIVKNKAQEE